MASTDAAVGRRIAKILDALDGVTRYVCDGQITQDVDDFGQKLREHLRAEHWRIHATDNNRWQVLPPRKDRKGEWMMDAVTAHQAERARAAIAKARNE